MPGGRLFLDANERFVLSEARRRWWNRAKWLVARLLHPLTYTECWQSCRADILCNGPVTAKNKVPLICWLILAFDKCRQQKNMKNVKKKKKSLPTTEEKEMPNSPLARVQGSPRPRCQSWLSPWSSRTASRSVADTQSCCWPWRHCVCTRSCWHTCRTSPQRGSLPWC